jgi:hypothetical protein
LNLSGLYVVFVVLLVLVAEPFSNIPQRAPPCLGRKGIFGELGKTTHRFDDSIMANPGFSQLYRYYMLFKVTDSYRKRCHY